jgi:hypothetical protein
VLIRSFNGVYGGLDFVDTKSLYQILVPDHALEGFKTIRNVLVRFSEVVPDKSFTSVYVVDLYTKSLVEINMGRGPVYQLGVNGSWKSLGGRRN